jgi:hypothetical protein
MKNKITDKVTFVPHVPKKITVDAVGRKTVHYITAVKYRQTE